MVEAIGAGRAGRGGRGEDGRRAGRPVMMVPEGGVAEREFEVGQGDAISNKSRVEGCSKSIFLGCVIPTPGILCNNVPITLYN